MSHSNGIHFTGGSEVFTSPRGEEVNEGSNRYVWKKGRVPRKKLPFSNIYNAEENIRTHSQRKTLFSLNTGAPASKDELPTILTSPHTHVPVDLQNRLTPRTLSKIHSKESNSESSHSELSYSIESDEEPYQDQEIPAAVVASPSKEESSCCLCALFHTIFEIISKALAFLAELFCKIFCCCCVQPTRMEYEKMHSTDASSSSSDINRLSPIGPPSDSHFIEFSSDEDLFFEEEDF